MIREALDLCPSEKLLWSTDGHFFPETYLLATMQIKEGLERVLFEYVDRQALSFADAIKIVKELLFYTANRIYDLDLEKSSKPQPMSLYDRAPLGRRSQTETQLWNSGHQFHMLKALLDQHDRVKFLRLQWIDYTATLRVRVLPIKYAIELFSQARGPGVPRVALGLLQTDVRVDGFSSVGEYLLQPDFASFRLSGRRSYASVQCDFKERGGGDIDICPRTILQRQIERASDNGIKFRMGFEIEVAFLRRESVNGRLIYGGQAMSEGHAW